MAAIECGIPVPAWHAAQAVRKAVGMALLALMAACGPGVGGTGVGVAPSALDAFGASAASVCGGDLATLLSCPPAGSTAQPTPGAAPVHLASTAGGAPVSATLQGDTIELDAPCVPLQFRGQWGVVPGQAARYYGFTDPGATSQPATLEVQAGGGGSVQLTLREADGRILLGPVTVAVVALPAAPGACR